MAPHFNVGDIKTIFDVVDEIVPWVDVLGTHKTIIFACSAALASKAVMNDDPSHIRLAQSEMPFPKVNSP